MNANPDRPNLSPFSVKQDRRIAGLTPISFELALIETLAEVIIQLVLKQQVQKENKNVAEQSETPRLTLKVGKEADSKRVVTLLSKHGIDASTILVSDQPTPELVVGNNHYWGFRDIGNFINVYHSKVS